MFSLVRVYCLNGRNVVHPNNSLLCETFHHVGQKCVCEAGQLICEAVLPESFFMQPTGEVIRFKRKFYEIFTVPA